MQRKKRFWMVMTAGAGLLVVLLIGILLNREKGRAEEAMPRNEATRALALAVADPEYMERFKEEDYETYLTEKQLWESSDQKTVRTGELITFAKGIHLFSEGVNRHPEGKGKVVTRGQFWTFFRRLAEKEKDLELSSGIAVASDEDHLYLKEEILSGAHYGKENLLDCRIVYYKKGNVLIGVTEAKETEVIYENVLVTDCRNGRVTLFLYGGYRDFVFPQNEGLYRDAVMDVKINNRKVEEIRLKSEEIRAKVLGVSEEAIELEGYGEIPFSEHFVMYKGYGEYEVQSKRNIQTGYDIHKFYVAEGKVCAGLTTRTLEAETIRVLLTTSGFASRFHERVAITCKDSFQIICGEEVTEYPAGAVAEFVSGSEGVSSGRTRIRSKRERFPLEVLTLERNSGTPSYLGELELKQYEEGLVLVNEVFVEDYLMQVVPSEVPASFHEEARKVQAIAARTYACRGIEENACWEYGAHVDDSENFQVYANAPANPETEEAVRDTYGQILKYGEEAAVIYYFSTSCGATAGPEIWGGSSEMVPYMEPKWIGTEEHARDLTKEEEMRDYLSTVDESAYEKECEWFRWSLEVTTEELTRSINGNLWARQKVNPSLILVKEGETYKQQEIEGIGKVESLEIVERGRGGTVETMKILGSEREILVSGQTNIRTLLGNMDCVYQTLAGPVKTYRAMLQSSFFYLEKTEEGYRIIGGGKGHGLGMPQNGMNQMALLGKTAEEILAFFFAGTQVHCIY